MGIMANLTPDPNSDELSTLLMEVEEFFVENIPMAVKQEILVEPIYGIILIYSGTDTDVTGYPPILLLPTVAYRDRVHSTMRPGDWNYMLWTSCEISGQPGVHSAVCDDPKLR